MSRFTIIMPTKDRPQFIGQAVEAIRAQDFTDWELLIGDGGCSIDHLLPADPRIRYFRVDDPADRRGDMLLRMAGGEIIGYQADDDMLAPGALAHVDATIGAAQWLYGRIEFTNGLSMGDPWDWERLKQQNFIPAPAVFWTRSARDIIGSWDRRNDWAHDWDYWLRLGARWTPVFTPRTLAIYRVHPGQATAVTAGTEKAAGEALIRQQVAAGVYRPNDLTLVVVAANQADADRFDRSHVGADVNLQVVVNAAREPLSRIGNRYLGSAQTPVVGLCHADCWFGPGALASFAQTALGGAVCGIVGVTKQGAYIWAGGETRELATDRWIGRRPGCIPVETMDSCSVFLRRDLGLRFDENTFDGLHCHVEDVCMQAHAKKIPVVVPPAECHHIGQSNNAAPWRAEYQPYRDRLCTKWGGPVMTT